MEDKRNKKVNNRLHDFDAHVKSMVYLICFCLFYFFHWNKDMIRKMFFEYFLHKTMGLKYGCKSLVRTYENS